MGDLVHDWLGTELILNQAKDNSQFPNFSSIAPGVTVGGGVSINTCSAISLGVNILESLKVGKYSVIGAGSLVNKNIKDYKIAYGLPAREIRNRKKNEKY